MLNLLKYPIKYKLSQYISGKFSSKSPYEDEEKVYDPASFDDPPDVVLNNIYEFDFDLLGDLELFGENPDFACFAEVYGSAFKHSTIQGICRLYSRAIGKLEDTPIAPQESCQVVEYSK